MVKSSIDEPYLNTKRGREILKQNHMVPNYILPADAAFRVYINRSDFTFAHVYLK